MTNVKKLYKCFEPKTFKNLQVFDKNPSLVKKVCGRSAVRRNVLKTFRMGVISVKCRKCRHLLFCHPENTLFTAHGESYSNVSVKYVSCGTIQEDNIWFLEDNNLPQWISDIVNNSKWTKGKVNCPNCQGRLGSFDFVSGTQCQCRSHVLPPVHIVKCKVDCRNQ